MRIAAIKKVGLIERLLVKLILRFEKGHKVYVIIAWGAN